MKKLLLLPLLFFQIMSFSQTEIIVNRRQNEDNSNPRNIPRNQFQIKESNSILNVISFLKDDPRTMEFSQEVTVQNGVPVGNESTFNFGSTVLTPSQESVALAAIIEYRDKSEFTLLEQTNINYQEEINDALEQVGDDFDEDSISELVVPDICSLREDILSIYDINGWNSFSVGEKRILIADWLIPSINERKEIFQSNVKRNEIYRLFAARITRLNSLENIRALEVGAFDLEGSDFTTLFKNIISPGLIDLEVDIFSSRSSTSSSDATINEIHIPIFSNIRDNSDVLTVLNDSIAVFNKNTELDIEYSSTINCSQNKNWQVKVLLNNSNIDGNGMRREGRGRNSVTHPKVRINVSEGDTLEVKLLPLNANSGSLVALGARSYIRIEEPK